MADPSTDAAPMESWTIQNSAVQATVNALGGMVAPVYFTLPDGPRIQPFKIAGWAERAEARMMPPVTRYLGATGSGR